jgi:hypothetical protein
MAEVRAGRCWDMRLLKLRGGRLREVSKLAVKRNAQTYLSLSAGKIFGIKNDKKLH